MWVYEIAFVFERCVNKRDSICPAEDDAAAAYGTDKAPQGTVHFSDARRSPLAKRHRPV